MLEDVVDACSGNDAPAVFAYIQSKVALFKKVWCGWYCVACHCGVLLTSVVCHTSVMLDMTTATLRLSPPPPSPPHPQPELYKHCKLLILRSINALLKRVSAPSAPALCGSMLMFLATFFPLSERSGVNVAGLYNTGNVTHIEDVAEVWVIRGWRKG